MHLEWIQRIQDLWSQLEVSDWPKYKAVRDKIDENRARVRVL